MTIGVKGVKRVFVEFRIIIHLSNGGDIMEYKAILRYEDEIIDEIIVDAMSDKEASRIIKKEAREIAYSFVDEFYWDEKGCKVIIEYEIYDEDENFIDRNRIKIVVPENESALMFMAGFPNCNHVWVPGDDKQTIVIDGGQKIWMHHICDRCGSLRKMLYSLNGEKLSVEFFPPNNK